MARRRSPRSIPKIDHLVTETQGVIVYQEQVMQIAQELSGYSLGEADLLRRAMGKKIRAEMDQQRERFVSGAVERGVGKPQADFIFDLLAKFADYGFNKIARRRLCGRLLPDRLSEGALPGRVPRRVDDARHVATPTSSPTSARMRMRLGIDVVPPSVMTSFRDFEVGENRIFYSLAAHQGRRRRGGRAHRRQARRKAVRRPRRFLRARRSEDRRQARASKA